MGKLLLLIIGIFLVLFAVRLYHARQGTSRPRTPEAAPPVDEKMVRCERCGVYLPRSESQLVSGRHYCRDPGCGGAPH
ncbi:MAG: hypothetical protein HYZ17_02670 [Betaproteobacteria bacterium]|jgi:late competence protein required for DNA uptake (superfamily II DNA/RNA helicase)|nr:hypothetical protein [Betaproteobacteria bacterium]